MLNKIFETKICTSFISRTHFFVTHLCEQRLRYRGSQSVSQSVRQPSLLHLCIQFLVFSSDFSSYSSILLCCTCPSQHIGQLTFNQNQNLITLSKGCRSCSLTSYEIMKYLKLKLLLNLFHRLLASGLLCCAIIQLASLGLSQTICQRLLNIFSTLL